MKQLEQGQSLALASDVTGEFDVEGSGSIQQGGSPGSGAHEGVERWPLWFAAESIVCVLQGGVLPFDLGSIEALNLRSLCVLKHPTTAPPTTSTSSLHDYDARCVACLTSLSSLTLPNPTSRSHHGYDFLRTFQKLHHLDISNPIGAPVPPQAWRTRPSASSISTAETSAARAYVQLPSAMHGKLKSLVATLPTVAASIAVLTQLTKLRLCGTLDTEQKNLARNLSALTQLQSLGISSPVAWATKSPGALLQHEVVDGMRGLAPDALSVLRCMPRLHTLSLAGCACIDNAALTLVALVTTLTSLDISVCRRLTDNGIKHLTALSMLRALDVSWCDRLGTQAAAAVSLLSELQSLDMSGCMNVDDVGVFALCNVKTLTALSLKGCSKVASGGLQRIVSLTGLRSVLVSSETDKGIGLSSWGQFGGTLHVTHVCLRGFKALGKGGLQCMARMRELREVTVDGCPGIDGAEISHLSGLRHLKKVALRFCPKIDDQAVMHLQNATVLEELSLQGSAAFYGTGLRYLAPLTRLHTLDLQQCTCVDATGLSFLGTLPRLLSVNVAKCPRIQGADFVHLNTLQMHPHLVVVGLEGRSLELARECGFRVAPSPAVYM